MRSSVFAGLSQAIINRIVEKFVLQLEAQLADRSVTFELSPDATTWLAEKGFDDEMGARPLSRIIQEHVKKPIADEILFGKLKHGGVVKVLVDKNDADKLAFEYVPEPEGADEPKDGGDDGGDGANVPALVE